jgi:hypothetical protein
MTLKSVLTLSIIIFLLLPVKHVHGVEHTVVINEILPDPEGTDAGKEWIEFKNLTNTNINLKGYRIDNINLDSGSIRSISILEDLIILGNGLGIISEGTLSDVNIPNLILGSGKLNLYNSKSKLVLTSPSGLILHEFIYNEVKSGKSVESPGFPHCIKNIINENGNTIGLENYNLYSVCSDTLQGTFEYSKDSENWSETFDGYSKQVYIRYKPTENIDISSIQIIDNGSSVEIIQPINTEIEKTFDLNIKLRTSFTNIEYVFDTRITIGKPAPKILFSLDNLNWSENIDTSVKAGTLLYFKEMNGKDTKIVLSESEYQSPIEIIHDINSEAIFNIESSVLRIDSLKISIIPELIITSVYPVPKSGETEYLLIKNISKYSFNKAIYLTDNIDNPVQKKFSINLPSDEETKITSPPSLNNSGDEIYLFVDLKIIDHIEYSQGIAGDIFTRTLDTSFPIELSKPPIPIPLVDIKEARKLTKGTQARIQGKVTYLEKEFGYIQDSTGGIRISGNLTDVVPGESYELVGDISESMGEKKLFGIENILPVDEVSINDVEFDTNRLDELVGVVISGTAEILMNYSKSFKILEKVSISLSGFEGFDRNKGDTIRFKGILSKGSADSFKIIPIELSLIESDIAGVQVSYPIAIIDPDKELRDTIEEIRSNGINSLVIGLGIVMLFFIYRFLKAKLEILVLKFSLWRESRKMQKSLSSERNMKSNIASVSS